MVPGRIFFKRRLVGFLTVLVAAVVGIDCQAACRRAPLGGDKAAYFPAMAKRMAAVHGIGMKKIVQKGNYAGGGFSIVWYRFGTEQENEDATGIKISDGPAPGAVGPLMFLGDNSQANLDRMRTLTAATVSYFTHIDESQIAPEIDAMLKKVVAAEPKKDDVLTDYWKNSTKPVAQHQWGNVYVDMPTSPQVLNAVSVTIGGPCK